jgi:hypothetical protein
VKQAKTGASGSDRPVRSASPTSPPPMPAASAPTGPSALWESLVHGGALALALATLFLVGQPIFANDTWIHLALGEAFSYGGPWLSADPHLFAAPGPPAPGSWLGSWGIFQAYDSLGFAGLRVVHVLVVGFILWLAWRVVRHGSGSAAWASTGVVFFILLSTYRIVQLRPHLFTIGATLALYLILMTPREGPSRIRIGLAAALTLIWANVHAAFLLGPVLVLGVSASLFTLLLSGIAPEDSLARQRASRIGIAGLAILAASLVNPQGGAAHLSYFMSGKDTLALTAVADEWGATDLLSWPVDRLPPTLAAWWLCWLCVLALVWGGALLLSELRREKARPTPSSREPSIDPALFALSVASVLAAVMASRFLWMGIFPVTLMGGCLLRLGAGKNRAKNALGWTMVIAVSTAGLAHFKVGDWSLVSRSLGFSRGAYALPYHAEKYYGHSMWFLADTGVEGRIFNEYPLGGFMSFWLSPQLQMASSGTMNVARAAMEENLAIAGRRSGGEGESVGERLDRRTIDLFLGTGLPVHGPATRPVGSTVRHLEREEGWIQVFRSLRSAVYLRRNAKNAENLDRIAAYYAAFGVPFDPETGFDVDAVVTRAPAWSEAFGLIPTDFEARLAAVHGALRQNQLAPGAERLATMFAALGLYDRALRLDHAILRIDRSNGEAAQRIIWSLLHQSNDQGALEAARQFDGLSPGQAGSGVWMTLVEDYLSLSRGSREERLARLPLLAAERTGWLRHGIVPPASREKKSRRDDTSLRLDSSRSH